MEHGPRDERPDFGLVFAMGRLVGFAMLMIPAVATLAAVVLLPPYAHLCQTRYEAETLRAGIRDAESLVKANERLIAALPDDPVLTVRLALNQTSLWPRNEIVVTDPAQPSRAAALVRPVLHERPRPPSGWHMQVAEKLKDSATRRGLVFLAAGVMLAAMFLFAPPVMYQKSE